MAAVLVPLVSSILGATQSRRRGSEDSSVPTQAMTSNKLDFIALGLFELPSGEGNGCRVHQRETYQTNMRDKRQGPGRF